MDMKSGECLPLAKAVRNPWGTMAFRDADHSLQVRLGSEHWDVHCYHCEREVYVSAVLCTPCVFLLGKTNVYILG